MRDQVPPTAHKKVPPVPMGTDGSGLTATDVIRRTTIVCVELSLADETMVRAIGAPFALTLGDVTSGGIVAGFCGIPLCSLLGCKRCFGGHVFLLQYRLSIILRCV